MPTSDSYQVSGIIELFPQKGGWHYPRVPDSVIAELSWMAERSLIGITATLGSTTWDTSVMPTGDGSHFIPLNARVRRDSDLKEGEQVEVEFVPRHGPSGRR
ncbi:MAG: DUF1905 domain-containing protein [Acidimicrobiia bacterium]|nr:DUF1905 domain-containing protein [Acidimicrobiia bacterium]